MSLYFPKFSVLLAAALFISASTWATQRPAILEVQSPPPSTPAMRPGLSRIHSAGIIRDLDTPIPQTFRVTWSPGESGIEPGASLIFDFRQQHREQPGRLTITYPSAIREQRTAEFTVGPRALREHGPVTGWRVSLYSGGRRLATRTSDFHASPGLP